MTDAHAGCEDRQARISVPTEFALVAGFLRAFIQRVLAFVGTGRVAHAYAAREDADARIAVAAVFTVIITHGNLVFVGGGWGIQTQTSCINRAQTPFTFGMGLGGGAPGIS